MLTFKSTSEDMRSIVRIGLLLVVMFSSSLASAQFYNGMQMNFGKNRLQFNNRYWKYYRFDRFDVYSYENGTDLSLYVADFVEKELALIERFFDYDIERQELVFDIYEMDPADPNRPDRTPHPGRKSRPERLSAHRLAPRCAGLPSSPTR